jgi:hypothetical protein
MHAESAPKPEQVRVYFCNFSFADFYPVGTEQCGLFRAALCIPAHLPIAAYNTVAGNARKVCVMVERVPHSARGFGFSECMRNFSIC